MKTYYETHSAATKSRYKDEFGSGRKTRGGNVPPRGQEKGKHRAALKTSSRKNNVKQKDMTVWGGR